MLTRMLTPCVGRGVGWGGVGGAPRHISPSAAALPGACCCSQAALPAAPKRRAGRSAVPGNVSAQTDLGTLVLVRRLARRFSANKRAGGGAPHLAPLQHLKLPALDHVELAGAEAFLFQGGRLVLTVQAGMGAARPA